MFIKYQQLLNKDMQILTRWFNRNFISIFAELFIFIGMIDTIKGIVTKKILIYAFPISALPLIRWTISGFFGCLSFKWWVVCKASVFVCLFVLFAINQTWKSKKKIKRQSKRFKQIIIKKLLKQKKRVTDRKLCHQR